MKQSFKKMLCMALVFVMMVGVMPATASANDRYIADSFTCQNFLAAVLGVTGVSTPSALRLSDVQNIMWLDVAHLNITSLAGIEHFANLEVLSVVHNSLSELDLSNNTNLRALWASNNQITTVDVSQNRYLDYLTLAHNNLTSIDVSNNPLLRRFVLGWGNNSLQSIDVSNNPLLEDLDVGGNALTSIDVSNNPLLEVLDLGDNALTSIDLSSNPLLRRFSAGWGNNRIQSIDLSNNPLLEYLNLGGNALTSIDVSNNPLLQVLDVSWGDNDISSLDVSNNPLLRRLVVANNSLTSLDISNNPHLEFVNAIYNQMSGVDDVKGWDTLFNEVLDNYELGGWENHPNTGFIFFPQHWEWTWDEPAQNPYNLRECEIIQGFADGDTIDSLFSAGRIRFWDASFTVNTYNGTNYISVTERDAAWYAIEVSPKNLNAGDLIVARGSVANPAEGMVISLMAREAPWEGIAQEEICPDTGMFTLIHLVTEAQILDNDNFDTQFRNGFRLQVANEDGDNHSGGAIADFNLYDFFVNPPTGWEDLPLPGQTETTPELKTGGVHFPNPQNNDGFSNANANAGSTANLHLNVVRLDAPQNATYRVEWLRNGVVFSTGTFNMPNNRESRISLQLQNVSQNTHGGDWQARIFTVVNGVDVFMDTSPAFRLSVSTPSQGGSGNGGSQAPTQPTAPVTSIPANDGAIQVGVQVRDNRATISMTGNVRNQVRDNAEGYVSFDLSQIEGLETAVMARSDWNNFARAGLGVEIAMPAGTLAFDPIAARHIGDITTGSDIESTITEITPNALTPAQQNTLGEGDLVFQITVMANNRYVREFNGNLSITVPFEGTPPVGAWRLAADGTLEQLPATFCEETRTVTFATNRLSMFKVGYDPAAVITTSPALMRFAVGVTIGDATPFIDPEANRTMVPLRAVAEGLGAQIEWDDTTRTVSIILDGASAQVTIDQPLPNNMGTAVIKNDRTFVPVRYVSEVLGAEVRWDEQNQAVYIY